MSAKPVSLPRVRLDALLVLLADFIGELGREYSGGPNHVEASASAIRCQTDLYNLAKLKPGNSHGTIPAPNFVMVQVREDAPPLELPPPIETERDPTCVAGILAMRARRSRSRLRPGSPESERIHATIDADVAAKVQRLVDISQMLHLRWVKENQFAHFPGSALRYDLEDALRRMGVDPL